MSSPTTSSIPEAALALSFHLGSEWEAHGRAILGPATLALTRTPLGTLIVDGPGFRIAWPPGSSMHALARVIRGHLASTTTTRSTT